MKSDGEASDFRKEQTSHARAKRGGREWQGRKPEMEITESESKTAVPANGEASTDKMDGH